MDQATDERGHEPDRRDRRSSDQLLIQAGLTAGIWLSVLVVTAVALVAAEIAFPAVLGRAIDTMTGQAPTSWLVWCGVLIGVLVALDTVMEIGFGMANARSTAWLRHSVLRKVLALGPRWVANFNAGDVASRLVGNSATAGVVASDGVGAAVNLIPAVGGIVALALIDPWLCVTFAAGLPLLLVLLRAFAREASDMAFRYFEVQGQIAGRLADALSGARTIAAAGTQEREAQRILTPLPDLHKYGMSIWRAQIRMEAQDNLILPLMEIAVLAVAGFLLSQGRITPGELVAASQYVALGTGIGSAINIVARLARARAGAGRVAEVLGKQAMEYGEEHLPAGRGRVDFRSVTVRVDGRVVLDALDLALPAGVLIAVVGRSGAGKSVLVAMVGRLVDPDEGEVLLDGMAVSRVRRAELRREVTYGFERPALMGQTVRDVIAFGAYTPSQETLIKAATAARADDFIRRMPKGYETHLADAPMSGGEVQRLGLARAFAHVGRVLILDDVAASLDTITEHHISRILTDELSERTRLVVAHRASTAERADLVVWLEGGRVRALARHGELCREPDYRALFEAKAYSPETPGPPEVTGEVA